MPKLKAASSKAKLSDDSAISQQTEPKANSEKKLPRRKKAKKQNFDDKAFSLKAENKRNRSKRKLNHDPRPEGIFSLMRALTSPAKKSCELNPSEIAKTPPPGQKSPNGTHFMTPKGSMLSLAQRIDCEPGAYLLYLPDNKVSSPSLSIPSPNDWINKAPITRASLGPILDEPLNWKRIVDIRALVTRNKRDGKVARGITQNKLMNYPATKALQNAGFDLMETKAHWSHLLPWALVSIQEAYNLGIGTCYANARMELINRPLEDILRGSPEKTLYMSAIPTWVEGFEKIRLLKSVEVIIRDGLSDDYKHSAKIDFDMLSNRPVCGSEIMAIANFLKKKFNFTPNSISKPENNLAQTLSNASTSLHFLYKSANTANHALITPPKSGSAAPQQKITTPNNIRFSKPLFC